MSEEDLNIGRIYPSLAEIKEVSVAIAIEVARMAYDEGNADISKIVFAFEWNFYPVYYNETFLATSFFLCSAHEWSQFLEDVICRKLLLDQT